MRQDNDNRMVLVPLEPPDSIPEDFDMELFELCRKDDYRGLCRVLVDRALGLEAEVMDTDDKQLRVTRVAGTFEVDTARDRRDRLAEFCQKWQEDSELIALAKEAERTRIVGILRANALEWDSNPVEPQLVRGAVSRALRSIADSLERES